MVGRVLEAGPGSVTRPGRAGMEPGGPAPGPWPAWGSPRSAAYSAVSGWQQWANRSGRERGGACAQVRAPLRVAFG